MAVTHSNCNCNPNRNRNNNNNNLKPNHNQSTIKIYSQAAIVLYFVFFAKSGFSFFYVCPLPKEHN